MVTEIAYKITIQGFVQGVLFRDRTRREALRLGLKGYVRNKDDDCVEILAIGLIDNLDELVKWCHAGPELARVDYVDVKTIDVKDSFEDFKIIF